MKEELQLIIEGAHDALNARLKMELRYLVFEYIALGHNRIEGPMFNMYPGEELRRSHPDNEWPDNRSTLFSQVSENAQMNALDDIAKELGLEYDFHTHHCVTLKNSSCY